MTLNPQDILGFVKQLPTFEGAPGTLQKFIVSVEEVIMLIRGTDQTPYGQLLLRILRNKVIGKADEVLNMLDTKLEWDSIRDNLKRMYSCKKSEPILISEIQNQPVFPSGNCSMKLPD
ncbi:GM19334 [Drosophila sechellia]|uniref:GM19334 n=1 Tax=Drosophila sechellia TaxID=7238 RepID=B4IKV2_DROSE|nr:GM19334 [Drosophila sechellia]